MADGLAVAAAVNNQANCPPSTPESPILPLHIEVMTEGDRSQQGTAGLLSTDSQGSDFISLQPQEAGTWRGNGEQKVTCRGLSAVVAGVEREPFTEIFFRLNCTRSGRRRMVQLTVNQVDFGVKNCCTGNCAARKRACDPSCKTVFIRGLAIELRPKSWAQADCHRLQLQPQHTAEDFGLQRSSTLSCQMPLADPRRAFVSYQIGNTVSRNAPAFGWGPARRDDATNSVSWTLELYIYSNSRKLELNKVRWGSRPVLPIRPDHVHIHQGSFLTEALWELQPHAVLQQERLEWDLKITLHTAVSQSKRRLPAYSVTMGPILTFEKLLTFKSSAKD